MDFLAEEYKKGLSYSALNTARSALSSFILLKHEPGFAFGKHPLVIRFIKAVHNLRPPVCRYTDTWDVDIVLSYIRRMDPVRYLSLKDLTLKLVMLLGILSIARAQGLRYLSLDNMKVSNSGFTFHINDLLKHYRPGYNPKPMVFKAYPINRKLCVCTVLREYIRRTKHIRNSKYLLISYIKPHNQVTSATISRWLRTLMARAGIDTNTFKAHSVRSAASSKAMMINVPLKTILTSAGWSSDSTFKKYYYKTVKPQRDMTSLLD